MILSRLKVSKETTDKMKQVKQKLKIGPMYSVARMGLTLSLSDSTPPQREYYLEDGMEFNRLTLFGEYDSVYMSMLKTYGLYKDGKEIDDLSAKETTSYLVAHINRGVIKLFNRVKNQDDLFELVQEQQML